MVSDPGCYERSLIPSSLLRAELIDLPFWARFGANTYRHVWVTNVGHASINSPFGGGWDSGRNMQTTYGLTRLKFAPWWGIVTGSTSSGGSTTTFGEITYQGRPAICATWTGIGHVMNTCSTQPVVNWSETNNFQLLLVDRGDVGYEDFDIVFNYGSVQWDFSDTLVECVGPPGAGYTIDTGLSGEVVAGSWTYGSFLDSNPTGLVHRTLNSTQPGRLVYQVRNGQATPSVPGGGTYGEPTATGPGGWAENPTVGESDPVNTATGSYYTSATDLSLPGVGVPFAQTRTYNSADPATGTLGPGWTHALAASLEIQPNGDVLARAGDGQQIYFTSSGGSFSAPGFSRSALTAVAGGYELLTQDQIRFRFDTQGRLTSQKDRNAQGLTLTYGGDGLLQSVTDSVNRSISYAHSAGRLTQVTLPDGRRVAYSYDQAGRLETVTDARNGVTRYTYDAGGRLKTIIDQNQHTVVDNTYGPDGRVVSQRNALLQEGMFFWDAATTTSTYRDARGNEWKDVYRNNLLVEQIDQLGNRTLYRYDEAANLTDVIDARGVRTTMTYDARGNLLTRSAPAATWTYNALNDPLTFRDARDNTTDYGYDSAGNLTLVRGPPPGGGLPRPETLYGRDASGTGLLTSLTDPRGKMTAFTYTGGNLSEIRTPLGNRTTMQYDGSGRMTSLVEPRGNATGANPADYRWTYTFTATNALETQTDPLGSVTALDYDPAGNLNTRTDANGNVTTYGYDAANRLITVTAPDPDEGGPLAAPVTRYTYDPVGNLASREDANQRTTSYEYDAADRLIRATHPLNRVWTYAYDANGNLTQVVDANGNATPQAGDGQTTHTYGDLNRLLSIDYADATPDVSFFYDANGNRTRMTDGAGFEDYVYDALNRLTSVTRGTNSFTYTYDLVNLTQVRYPDTTTVAYTHDDDGRLQTALSGAQTTSYAYDQAGNLTQTTLPAANGYVETRAYDRAGRLTSVESKRGSSTLSRFAITLDSVGNPLSVVRTGSLAQTQTYTYDDMNRLTSVCFQAGTCPGGSDPFIRWSYDGVGNRLTEARSTGTTSYTYNAADELTQAGASNYSYDQNGNQLSGGARTFAYDLANRLKSTTAASETTTYSYDGDGKRLQASTGTQASKKTNYLWDISTALPQIVLERNGSDALLRRYVYGARRISMTSGSATSYYVHDGLGSVANLTSSTGSTQWTWSYEPYGAIRTEQKASGSQPTNFMKFAGEYLDPSGLYHLRARQLDPASGLLLTRDPLCLPPGTPTTSRYAYVERRPTVLIDPSGMSSEGPSACGVVTGTMTQGVTIGAAAAAGDFVSGVNRAAERLDEALPAHIRAIPRYGEAIARRALPAAVVGTALYEACASRAQGASWPAAVAQSAVENGGAAVGATTLPLGCLALAPTGWGAVACAGGMAIIGGVGGHELGERIWDWIS